MESYEKKNDIIGDGTLNCAQKIVGSFCEALGIPLAEGLRMARPLGGGLRAGEACGALVGGLLVSGFKYGTSQEDPPEARAVCDEKAVELTRRFMELHGEITCRALLGIDTSVGDNRRMAAEMGLFRDVCPNIVVKTIELLEELGYGDGKKQRE